MVAMERCRSTLPRLRRSAPAEFSLGGDPRHQVADMDHAARIVERLAIDRQARMLGLAEHAHQLVDGDAVVDGNDVGARHHDVLDRELAEAEDAAEHAAFLHAQRVALAARQRVLDQFAEIGLLAKTELFAAGDRTRMLPRRTGVARRPERRPRRSGCCSSRSLRIVGVRIGNPERGKHGSLDRFHPLGLGVLDVIQADEMQHAVHHEMGDVIVKRDVLRSRFLGVVSKASTTSPSSPGPFTFSWAGKREHVGRRVLAAPRAVERAHLGVVGENARLT